MKAHQESKRHCQQKEWPLCPWWQEDLVIDVAQVERRQDSRHLLQRSLGLSRRRAVQAKSVWRRASCKGSGRGWVEEELSVSLSFFFFFWQCFWSPGNAGRKNTDASLSAGFHINVMGKRKEWSQRTKIMVFAGRGHLILKTEKNYVYIVFDVG